MSALKQPKTLKTYEKGVGHPSWRVKLDILKDLTEKLGLCNYKLGFKLKEGKVWYPI